MVSPLCEVEGVTVRRHRDPNVPRRRWTRAERLLTDAWKCCDDAPRPRSLRCTWFADVWSHGLCGCRGNGGWDAGAARAFRDGQGVLQRGTSLAAARNSSSRVADSAKMRWAGARGQLQAIKARRRARTRTLGRRARVGSKREGVEDQGARE